MGHISSRGRVAAACIDPESFSLIRIERERETEPPSTIRLLSQRPQRAPMIGTSARRKCLGDQLSAIVLAAASWQLLLSLLRVLRPQRDGIKAGGTLTLIISLNATLSLKPAFDVILSLELRANKTIV